MSERVKIYIHATGQETTGRWRLEHIEYSNSNFLINLAVLDEIPDLKEFPMFSNVTIFFKDGTRETEFYCGAGKLIEKEGKEFSFWFGSSEESEKTTMKHKVTITTNKEKTVEEFWIMKTSRLMDVLNSKISYVHTEKELNHKPTIEEIAQFLSDSQADFVTVSHNYRFAKEI